MIRALLLLLLAFQANAVTKTVVYTVCAGANTLPADFGTLISIEAIGSGGYPSATSSAGGGGGGAYAKTTSVTGMVANGSFYCSIGSPGDAWFNISSNAAPTVSTSGVLAKGGGSAANYAGGAGGSAANSVGSLTYAGGAGGAGAGTTSSGTGVTGGGGGAGGPNGAGAIGGAAFYSSATNFAAGGGGGANGGSAGGAASSNTGGTGGNNRAGSGGGAAGTVSVKAGAGTTGGGGGGNFYSNSSNLNNASADLIWTNTANGIQYGPSAGYGGCAQTGSGTAWGLCSGSSPLQAGGGGTIPGSSVFGGGLIVLTYTATVSSASSNFLMFFR